MATDDSRTLGAFNSINSKELLDAVFLGSFDVPKILFKHSLTCAISSIAYQEMKRLAHEVSIIVIQESRDTSREVEMRTGIRHESPQVIIVRNGAAVWNASHGSITASEVERAVSMIE